MITKTFILTSATLLILSSFKGVNIENKTIRTLRAELKKVFCNGPVFETLADELNKIKNYESTIELTEKYLKKCDKYFLIRWRKYSAHTFLKQYEKALHETNELIKVNPSDPDYYYWKAETYDRMNRKLKAVKVYKQAIKLAPKSEILNIELAELYLRMEEFCKASGILKFQ